MQRRRDRFHKGKQPIKKIDEEAIAVPEGVSLFILKSTNPVRKFIHWLAENNGF